MSEVKRFVTLASANQDVSQLVLYRFDEANDQLHVATVDVGEKAVEELLSVIRTDLSYLSGTAKYLLVAMSAAGRAINSSPKLCMRGTAPRSPAERANGVNDKLVSLVAENFEKVGEHWTALYDRQNRTIDEQGEVISSQQAIIQRQSELIANLRSTPEQPAQVSPMVAIMHDRMGKMLDLGMQFAGMGALGKLAQNATPPEKVIAQEGEQQTRGGIYAEWRRILAYEISDAEIGKLAQLLISSGLVNTMLESLEPATRDLITAAMGA
jgi:hypothetical protein